MSWLVEQRKGLLVIDDTLVDKPHSCKIELMALRWSGKHRLSVRSIPLVSLVWTDGNLQIPTNYRVHAKGHDGTDKHGHCRQMLRETKERWFSPECVLFDSLHASLYILKLFRSQQWQWRTWLKKNRKVNPDGSGNIPLAEVDFPNGECVSHEGIRHDQCLHFYLVLLFNC